MTNRLRKLLRALPFCVGISLFFLPVSWLKAQPGFFNFSYNGPSTLSVGPTCSAMLQGSVPDPIVSSAVGANITMSMFDPVASTFQYNDLFTSGTTAHVYWFVKDDAGHEHTYDYFINFIDNTPPAFNLTGVFDTLEFSSVVQVPTQTALPVADNCTPVVSQTFSQTPGPDTCQSGTITRTWMATDANNNTATFTQTIIIYKDSLPPEITGYPQNGSAACELLATAYPNWLATQIATFAATDASGVASLTNNAPAVFPSGCKVPFTVRFKAVDNCAFQRNVFVTFSTSDTEGPVVIKPPKDTVAYCSPSDNELTKLREWISTKAYSQAFDSCSFPLSYVMKIGGVTRDSAQVVSDFLAAFSNGCSTQNIGGQSFDQVHAKITVAFYVQDDCGNETMMGNADFGAIDTLPPVITGVNTTEQCGGGNDQSALQAWINAHGNATVIEDCSGFTWTNFSFTTSTGQTGNGNFNVGPYPTVQANNCNWFTNVTFRATDDCGNSNTITLRWSIEDTQVPVFTGLQPNITVYCPNPLPTVPAAVVTDNCDANLNITFSRIYKDSLCDGSYTVLTTWTALDDCGNSSSATQNIFVSDTTRPVFTLIPANKTFRCDTFVLPPVPVMGVNIAATDVCSPVVSITTTTNSFQNPDPAVCAHYSYNIVRTFIATDECGNTSTASQTLSIIDNLGPVPGGILDTTALCSALTPFPAPIPIATDACSGITAPPTTSGQSTTPGLCTDRYTISVHWLATDVCGNTTAFNQLVHVIDTVPPTLVNIPPNITVECDAIPSPPETAIFSAADNCDQNVSVNLSESEIRNPDTTNCAHWTNYILKREWTATDNCGNTRTYTQLIQIEDTTPPAIVPPGAMVFPNDLDDCGAEILIPAPLSITDVCSNQLAMVAWKDTAQLVLPPGAPSTSTVDTVIFQWTPPNLPPLEPVLGSATLTVDIDQADAEGPQEFFKIYGEGGVFLMNTNPTAVQCGSSTITITIPAGQLNNWLSDGSLDIVLVPQGVNLPPCPGFLNRVRVGLSYTYQYSNVPIDLSYTLDGGPTQSFPPGGPTFLTAGTHTVVYTATDCAGNASTSSVQITVNDTQAPNMIAPANILAFTGQNNCESSIILPFPVITENCEMSASLSLASAVMPLHFENDPDLGIIALDISPNLTGVIPNAVGMGTLKIRHKGHNTELGQFFNVFDEGGTPLGMTGQGTMVGECSTFFETPISVTAAQINSWAGASGNTFFYLATNRDPMGFPAFYISNCGPVVNEVDGISQVQVVLEYNYAVVDYAIKNASNQVVSTGIITGNITKDTLAPGNYTVMYTTVDNAGLSSMTSFAITVRDTVKPKALCQPTLTIFANPAGLPPYTLLPAQINNGSTDNCTPTANLSFSLSPNTFTCNQAGNNFNVTLTVTDSSGNSATCVSIVRVENERPIVSYIPVCEGGTLQLNCLTPNAAPNTFTYQWSGPQGFTSTVQNPEVTNNAMGIHNGPYCVTITGATGCTASACVVVSLAILNTTPQLGGNGFSFCPGQTVVLSTPTYQGQDVSYQWLLDNAPNQPIVLGETMLNNFSIPNLAPGTYTFYVKVFANGCNTLLSNPLVVTMHPTPPAVAFPTMIQKCEGDALSLQCLTPPTGGLTYSWSGPAGFSSTAQNPSVSNNVGPQHAGKYILVTQRNGCFSNPDTVMVTINNKPEKPELSGNFNACTGQTVTLVCTNLLNADQYLWTIPTASGLLDTTTTTNSLQIVNASPANNGNCTVIVASGGCFSDASDPIPLRVHDYPVISASSNSPICQDSLLKLMASFSSTEPLNWCWTFPNGTLQFVQNLNVPNGASGIYQVVAKTSNGCADTATVSVTNAMPPGIALIESNAPVCCDGSAVTLTATVIPTPASYSWTGPAFGAMPVTVASPVIGPDPKCTLYNGQYTLVVKDVFGCPSLPATIGINIQDPPATPLLTVSQQPVCAGTTVTLTFSNSTQGATYVWDRPGGLSDTTTNSTTLTILNAQPWHSGNYQVRAIAANGLCQSDLSNTVTVTVHPIPSTPDISSNSPVCVGGEIELYGPTIANASYFWTGPLGFVDNTEDPSRQPATLGMSGQYRLFVSVNNCASGLDSTLVTVVANPAQPVIALNTPTAICMDAPVTEFLNVINPVNGMIYSWKELMTNVVLQTSTASSLNLGMNNVLALGPGSHTFQVTATTPGAPGCNSIPSAPITIKFDTIPAAIIAYAGLDRTACIDSAIALTGSPNPLPSSITGVWTHLSGTVAIFEATTPVAWYMGMAESVDTFVWSISNGACQNFSVDSVIITAQIPEVAVAMDDIYSCDVAGIQLHATQGINTNGRWTQSAQQAGFQIVIDNPDDPNTTVSGPFDYGMNYAFTWEISNPGCGKSIDVVKVFIYNYDAIAGSNQFVCSSNNCTVLKAASIEGFELGKWESLTPGPSITSPGNDTTNVCGLVQGSNVFVWTTNNLQCGDRSRDTVEVFYALFPTANPDLVNVPFSGSAEVSVLDNDFLPAMYTVAITSPPVSGNIVDTLPGWRFVYRPRAGFVGTEEMTYRVCNTQCPDACSFATVTFKVSGADDCFIPTIITPNGDDFNDEFIIPQICTVGEGDAELEVTIFNQWGDVVFHEKPYQNNWRGTYNNEDLPSGTYYFVVKLNNVDKPRTGFLLIQR